MLKQKKEIQKERVKIHRVITPLYHTDTFHNIINS